MAERLTAADAGGDFGNISQATILNFVQEMKAAEEAIENSKSVVKEDKQVVKDLRKRIKNSGIRLDVFDDAYADAGRSQDDLDEHDRQYRYIMAALRDGGGEYPSTVEVGPEKAEHRALRMDRIEADGFDNGKRGLDISVNPWPQNGEEWARWRNGWTAGQAAKVHDELTPPQDARRGRRAAAD